MDNSYKWGGGGFLSTVGDLVRFGNILLYAKQNGDDKSGNTGLISDNNENNHNYIKILESDWSSAGLISAVIVQLHTSCACNWTVVRVMPE